MKKPVLPALAFAAACASPHAETVVYQLDPTHTIVHFEVSHFSTSTIRGRFGPVSGEVTLDRETGRGHVGLTIPTASVNTGIAPLDARLRQGDLLASDEYADAYFVTSNFTFDGKGMLKEVRGEFTLRGVSKPLALNVVRFNCYVSPLIRREVCGGDFEASFNRSEYGSTFGLPFVGDKVRLLIAAEAIRKGRED